MGALYGFRTLMRGVTAPGRAAGRAAKQTPSARPQRPIMRSDLVLLLGIVAGFATLIGLSWLLHLLGVDEASTLAVLGVLAVSGLVNLLVIAALSDPSGRL